MNGRKQVGLWVAVVVAWWVMPLAVAGGGEWNLKPDPLPEPIEIKLPDDVAFPFAKPKGEILRPVTPSRFVVLGFDTSSDRVTVWDLIEQKKVGEADLRSLIGVSGVAVSPDGRHAALLDSPNLNVWSLTDGQRTHSFGIAVYSLKLVMFRNATELVVMWDSGSRRVTILSLENNTQANIDLPEDIEPQTFAISPGGKYGCAASNTSKALLFMDLEQRKRLQTVHFGKELRSSVAFLASAFSPDGTELAMLVRTDSGEEIWCWDMETGKRHVRQPLAFTSTPMFTSIGRASDYLQWMPDGSGWLVAGRFLVDRNSGTWVWSFNDPLAGRPQLVDNDHLLVATGDATHRQAQSVRIPWKTIDEALTELEKGDSAWFGRGSTVAMDVSVKDVRLVPASEAKTAVTNLFTNQLKLAGVRVNADSDCICRVTYSEALGEELTIRVIDPRDFLGPRLRVPLVRRRLFDPAPEVSYGSGVLISTGGHVLTCAHVVGPVKQVRVLSGKKAYVGKVVKVDAKLDLALLKVEPAAEDPKPTWKALPLAAGEVADVGSEVRAFGFPLATTPGASLSVSKGTVSGVREVGNRKVLQVDAAVNPGNSGGPLLDDGGAVVGVNVSKVVGEAVDNVAFAVPVKTVREFLKSEKVILEGAKEQEKKLDGPALVKHASESIVQVISAPGGALPEVAQRLPEGDPLAPKPPAVQEVKVRATNVQARIELVAKGAEKGVWSWNYSVEFKNGRTFIDFPDETSVRQSAVHELGRLVREASLPVYISKAEPRVFLPGMTNMSQLAGRAKLVDDRLGIKKKPTTRGKE